MVDRRRVVSRAWIIAAAAGLPGVAWAQPAGPGGINFWNTPASGSWFDSLAWNGVLPSQGGVPDSTTTAHIAAPGAYTVSLLGFGSAAQCHHLSITNPAATLSIAGTTFRAELNIYGTQLDNFGQIILGGPLATQDSSIILQNNVTVAGSGQIRLDEPDTRTVALSSYFGLGYLFINGPQHAIRGHGSIRVRLDNNGTIEADTPSKTLRFDGSLAIVNNGSIRAINGASLVVGLSNTATGFSQSANGEIVAGNASRVFLSSAGSAGLSGGRLAAQGSGSFDVTVQGFPMEGVTIAPGTRIGFNNSNTGLIIRPNGITNNGLIATGPSGFVTSVFGQSGSIQGSGRVQLEGGLLANLFGGAGQALVNGPQHTIGGVGTIALALTNNGTVAADRNGATSGPSTLTLQTSNQINNGTMAASNGGTIQIVGVTLEQSANAVLHAADASAVALIASSATPGVVRGGTISTAGTGVIYSDTSIAALEGVRIAAGSRVLVPCARTLTLDGVITNDGTITVEQAGCGPSFAELRANASAQVLGSGSIFLRSSELPGNSRLIAQGAALTLGPAQTLRGCGELRGAIAALGAIEPERTFAPAGPAGTFTLAPGASLVLSPSAVFRVNVASEAAFDRIIGTGTIQVSGRLQAAPANGFTPRPGSSYTILSGTSVTGTFASVEAGPFQVEYQPTSVRLFICSADFDDGSGTGTPDGGIGIEDLLYYLLVFQGGTAAADLDNGSGTGTRDGGVGIEDLLYFLARFAQGC